MHFAIYVPLFAPLLVVPCLRVLAPRLHPRLGTHLVAGSMTVLGAGTTLSLTFLAMAGLVKLPVPQFATRWSSDLLEEHDAVALPVGVAAVFGLVVSMALVAQAGVGRVVALHRTRRLVGPVSDDAGITVVPDDDAYAYTLPGVDGRIVASTGLLRALTPAERRVVLAHERAHLAARHDLLHCVAMVAVRLHPALLPLRSTLHFTVERWADEAAVAETGDRVVAARAIGKAALLGRPDPVPEAALSAAAGAVPRRVLALLDPAPAVDLCRQLRSRAGLSCAAAMLVVLGAGLSTVEAASDLHVALEHSKISAR